MKRLLSLFLAMCLLILGGCGSSQKNSPAAKNKAKTAAPVATAKADGNYPSKPITLLITFEAGGTTDVATRLFVKYWQKHVSQNINVINIDGAGGNVGMAEAKKQANDGYYLVVQSGPFAMNAALGRANFTWEEFEPVSLFFESYMALCVPKNSPYKTFQEFTAAIKNDPQSIKYGVYSGSPMMSTLIALQNYTDKQFNIIDLPKTKSTEMLAGRVDAYCDAFAQMKPYIDSKDFRCLGIFAPNRLKEYPDIPTMKEMGVDYIITQQKYGMWAPKGTPVPILDYLNKTIKETYDDPEFSKELNKMCFVPVYTTRDEYATWLKDIYSKFADFVKQYVK